MKHALALIALIGSADIASANLVRGVAPGGGGGPPPVGPVVAPINTAKPLIVGLDYPNNGTTTALSGSSTTLKVQAGTWLNSPDTLTWRWHKADGTTIGTGASLTLNTTTYAGTVIEVDETGTNEAGTQTVTSRWFGPIETTLPTPPIAWETCYNTTTDVSTCPGGAKPTDSWPTPPGNFNQNGHYIFPGCAIPPAAPTNTATTGDPNHVWYFSPTGRSQKDMTDTGVWTGAAATGIAGDGGTVVPIASQGHKLNPFRDPDALVSLIAGYANPNFSGSSTRTEQMFGALAVNPHRTIAPGDTIYIEPGAWGVGANPAGIISGPNSNIAYSTSDGTTSGTLQWTWLMGDPAAVPPVIKQILLGNGNGSVAGWIIKGINVEAYRSNVQIQIGFNNNVNWTQNTHDVVIEDNSLSQWVGHSSDPSEPSNYPNSGGLSNGTITTASPTPTAGEEDFLNLKVTADLHSSRLYLHPNGNPPNDRAIATIGYYVTPPGLVINGFGVISPASGFPMGSKIVDLNGLNASQYNLLGVITAKDPSVIPNLAGKTLQPGSPFPTVAAMNAVTGSSTVYATVQTSATATQSAYSWNGTAWVGEGSFLPAAPAASNATYLAFNNASGMNPFNQNLLWWNGTAWADLGPTYVTIAPCDAVADTDTGCPANDYTDPVTHNTLTGSAHNNVPGCDPWAAPVGNAPSGGCPTSGAVPAWNGATRVLGGGVASGTGETGLSFMHGITVLPAGYWNANDFDGNAAAGIVIKGALDTTNSIEPSFPNYIRGVTCVSVARNRIRVEPTAMQILNTASSAVMGNDIKWVATDGIEAYSNNRVWYGFNKFTDPTWYWGHQDFIQGGDANGKGASNLTVTALYNNAFFENEGFQTTDLTNYAPRQMQCINNTENSYFQAWAAVNVCAGSLSNGVIMSGRRNVVAHNTIFGYGAGIGVQRKGTASPPAPSTKGPTQGLLANNVANSVNRVAAGGTWPPGIGSNICDASTGDLSTVEGNISTPQLTLGGVTPLGIYQCSLSAGTISSGSAFGQYVGLQQWTGTDWRTSQTGVSPLFAIYNPFGPPLKPAIGWQGLPVSQYLWSTCIQGSFRSVPCPGPNTANPNLAPADLHLNTGFTPALSKSITDNIVASVTYPCCAGVSLPSGKPMGAYGTTTNLFHTGSCDYPAGLWQVTGNTNTSACLNTSNGWSFVQAITAFNPGPIGAGTWLGAQQPYVDHEGKAWHNPPSIGAYETP